MGSEVPLVLTAPLYIKGSTCGYCHDQKKHFLGLENLPKQAEAPSKCTHITVGSYVEQMTSKHYSEFMDRGFRRLGQFLYKGDMLRGCCRMYAIRTNMSYLKITKEHRQCVNRFKKAICGETQSKKKLPPFDLQSLIEAEQNSTTFRSRFEPSRFSEEKFQLYKKYQVHVHNDDPAEVTRSQFKSFLCNTPFPEEEIDGTSQQWKHLNSWVSNWRRGQQLQGPKRFGPTHECYYLDDKLIAISVLDFLPTGLSSIYFIWDPDYAHLSLGTLLGVREIQMCHELGLGYYYLGYYIEDCPKMKYKAKFGGEILDVCNEAFLPLDLVGDFMADGRFFTVAAEADSPSPMEETEVTLVAEPKVWDVKPVDVSREIYENKQTYEKARQSLAILRESYPADDMKLPLVFPGAVPITLTLQWFESDAIGPETVVNIFTKTGRLLQEKLLELDASTRGSVVDCLRLFGPEALCNSILIIQ